MIHSIDEKKIGIEVDLKHVRFFDNKREDWLQYQGDILVGADLDGSKGTPLKDASLLKRNLIVMKMLEEHGALEGFLTRHQYRPFNKKHSTMDNVNYEMTVLSSDNVDERRTMEKHMAGNFYWNGEKMNPLSLAANTAGWVAGDAVRNTGKGVVALFNAGHFLALQGTRWANGDHYDNDEKRRNAVTPR